MRVAERIRLGGFSPKVVVFSVGLEDIRLGYSPLDVHKRVLDAIYTMVDGKLFPVCTYYIPVLCFKPPNWGVQSGLDVKAQRKKLKSAVHLYNSLLARDFLYTIKGSSVNSMKGAFYGSNPYEMSKLSEVGAAKLLCSMVRDIAGAFKWIQPFHEMGQWYDQAEKRVINKYKSKLENMVIMCADQIQYLNKHHKTAGQTKFFTYDMEPVYSRSMRWDNGTTRRRNGSLTNTSQKWRTW